MNSADIRLPRPARELPKVAIAAFLFSGAMLLGAYAFEFIGGLAPCQMCYWQRWAHWAVLAFALLTFAAPRAGAPLVALGLAGSAGVAAYHAGVEYGWWQGPQSCTATGESLDGIDPAAILGGLSEPMSGVDCSEPAWSMLGISMAGWNGLLSLGALVVVLVLMKQMRARS